ncbi:hypothetical protein SDC9_107860 [bioreactor metagenome]|uniref:Uncharacterized protein n=1 Tax=bioreactor metagenome TaxID=1076179 RepID=A0A645B7H5_9ZZZZ
MWTRHSASTVRAALRRRCSKPWPWQRVWEPRPRRFLVWTWRWHWCTLRANVTPAIWYWHRCRSQPGRRCVGLRAACQIESRSLMRGWTCWCCRCAFPRLWARHRCLLRQRGASRCAGRGTWALRRPALPERCWRSCCCRCSTRPTW